MSDKNLYLVKLYHGGKFVGNRKYLVGECLHVRDWDLEKDGDRFVDEAFFCAPRGYSDIVKYAFRKPRCRYFIFVKKNEYLSNLLQYADEKNKILQVYIEFDVDYDGKKIDSEEGNEYEMKEIEKVCDEDEGGGLSEDENRVNENEGRLSEHDDRVNEDDDGLKEDEEGLGLSEHEDGVNEDEGGLKEDEEGLGLSEHDAFDEDGLCDCDLSEDDEEFLEARTKLREDKLSKSQGINENTGKDAQARTENAERGDEEDRILRGTDGTERDRIEMGEWTEMEHGEGSDKQLIDEVDSDNDDDIFGDGDDNIEPMRKVYVKPQNPKDLKLELGLRFKDTKDCQRAVRDWAIVSGYDIKWNKSAHGKLQAVCTTGCDWRLYASTIRGEPTCIIKTLIQPHTCMFARKNIQVNAEWLAEHFLSNIKANPNYTAKEMATDLFLKLEVEVNPPICYRAKEIALERISGTLLEHYAKVGPYVTELKRTDKEGRFEIVTHRHKNAKGGSVFDRVYIGFSALKKGFLIGCKRFIGFDACFLKTVVKGVLLAVVSKDANNRMYPIAWAVVEKETEGTWKWFFEILFEELKINDGLGWTFMSDKQKGLINGIAALAPHTEHRHCARHIYANWRNNFTGLKFKILFWTIVRATSFSEYNLCLRKLRAESTEAADNFLAKGPSSFCKSLINPFTWTYLVVNNICECFNAYILKARDKPLIHILEHIRTNLMTRIYDLSKSLESSDDVLSPYTRKRLKKMQEVVRYCQVRPAIGDTYEVHVFDDSFVVDLKKRDCNCRGWELTGIPCSHALSSILHRRESIESYVHTFYYKSTLTECYSYGIQPLRGPKDWPMLDGSPILPPHFSKEAGRPRKNRKRTSDEVQGKSACKLSAKKMRISCRKCGGYDHNRRTCTVSGTSEVGSSDGAPKATKQKTTKQKATKAAPTDGAPKATKKKARQPRAPPKELREARKGVGIFQGESGNIYIRPPGAKRTVIGARAGAASRPPVQTTQDKGSQMSQVIDKSTPSQP